MINYLYYICEVINQQIHKYYGTQIYVIETEKFYPAIKTKKITLIFFCIFFNPRFFFIIRIMSKYKKEICIQIKSTKIKWLL